MDGHFPEDWIMSVVTARNIGREHIQDEGLSKLYGDETVSLKSIIDKDAEKLLGKAHYEKIGKQLGVLIKLIDSSERLTIQVHPDKKKALELFNSAYGKTECWHILGGRIINGENPCIYMGFKEGITKEKWVEFFNQQDISGMLATMNKFDVNQGDTVLIKGGIPHAIGAGCFLAEIQEPTDYTIRVEKKTPSGFKVDDFLCHQGLGFDKMFDCFDFKGVSKKEAKERWYIKPKVLDKQSSGITTALITYEDTDLFRMNEIKVTQEYNISIPATFSALYVLEGTGYIQKENHREEINPGNQFFVPAGTKKLNIVAKTPLRLLHCFGQQVNEE